MGKNCQKKVNVKGDREFITYYLYDKFGEEYDDRNLYKILNDEIEIIGEKEIPEKIIWDIEDNTYYTNIYDRKYKGNKNNFEELSDMYRQKINEIIDYLESDRV